MKSWIEISERRLTANYKTLNASAGEDVSVLAVIKADAYGHGAGLCAPVLARAGAEWLGVADVEEGVELRAALADASIAPGDQPRVLVMSGSLADEAELLVAHRLTPVVWSLDQLKALADAVPTAGNNFAVHVEVDTGMSRQGATVGAGLDAALRWLAAQGRLRLEGVMTHFSSAEVAGSRQTAAQQRRFEQAMRQVQESGLRPELVSGGNTSALDNLHATADDTTSIEWLTQVAGSIGARAMVRAGLALYGYALPVGSEPGARPASQVGAQSSVRAKLEPVMTWKTRVIGLREIEPGTQVGYGGTFTAMRKMNLALLPVGYADGLRRELSSHDGSGGWVVFGGSRAPIVGRVSMNLTVVDVTEIPAVGVGDEVVVLGEAVTADDHARLAGTIPYEILCGVKAGRRLR